MAERRWLMHLVVAKVLGVVMVAAAQAQSFTISTVAGTGKPGFSGDGGPAVRAELDNPTGVAVAADGGLYIADFKNRRIRRVDPEGTITTIAGDGLPPSSGDGGPAVHARLDSAYGVAVDRDGNVFLGDRSSYCVRRIDPEGTITRFAGTGKRGDAGDGGGALEAQLGFVNDIEFDADGNVYLADARGDRVRRVATDGTISTFAGTGVGGYSGDGGPATSAKIDAPSALCFDRHGALYICDFGNHCVRKVSADGTISTVAGTGKPGWGGDGRPATEAKLFEPCGVAVDRRGQVYIADSANSKIRVVRTDGTIATVAGTGRRGYSGDGGPATQAQIAIPDLIDVDAEGNIFIAEHGSHVIRKLSPTRERGE